MCIWRVRVLRIVSTQGGTHGRDNFLRHIRRQPPRSLVSVRVGGWIDDKTGFVLGAIITGGLLIFYFHAAKHAGTIYSHQP